MNFRQSIILSVATIAFAAPALSFATGLQAATGEAATAITFSTAASTLTRAEVLQDLKAARMDGSAAVSQEGAFNFAPSNTGIAKTRAQVMGELSSSMAARGVRSVM